MVAHQVAATVCQFLRRSASTNQRSNRSADSPLPTAAAATPSNLTPKAPTPVVAHGRPASVTPGP